LHWPSLPPSTALTHSLLTLLLPYASAAAAAAAVVPFDQPFELFSLALAFQLPTSMTALLTISLPLAAAAVIVTVGEPFETFSLALAFPADFNDSTVFDFSASIVRLQVGLQQGLEVGGLYNVIYDSTRVFLSGVVFQIGVTALSCKVVADM
jgi:hypothetical protein